MGERAMGSPGGGATSLHRTSIPNSGQPDRIRMGSEKGQGRVRMCVKKFQADKNRVRIVPVLARSYPDPDLMWVVPPPPLSGKTLGTLTTLDWVLVDGDLRVLIPKKAAFPIPESSIG